MCTMIAPQHPTNRRFFLVRSHPTLLSLFAILAVIACASKEQAKTDSAAPAQAGASADPAVVTFHAKDFAFDGPDQIPAGMTTFKLVNDGPNFHHLVIVRLDSGKTVADFGEAMKKQGPLPAWAPIIGGPNGPDPTKESNATLDLQPGNYVLLCFVDIPDHVPHAAKGMVKPLTVTAATGASAAAPAADLNVTLNEYAFQTSAPITAGAHTIKVTNAGAQDHEVELVKLAPGKKVDDLMKWMSSPKPEGPPPGSGIGGAIVGRGAGPVTFKADFTPGDYAFLCFIPDIKDGKPHLMKGMVQTFTIQ
jgi:hypothetical protein